MWLFDQNNQQMYQQYANSWDQGLMGNFRNKKPRELGQQFVQNALHRCTSSRCISNIMNRCHCSSVAPLNGGSHGSLMQQGFNPQQAGIQNTNLYSMSPNEAAQLTGWAPDAKSRHLT